MELGRYQCSEGISCLHLHCRRALPWRWRQRWIVTMDVPLVFFGELFVAKLLIIFGVWQSCTNFCKI